MANVITERTLLIVPVFVALMVFTLVAIQVTRGYDEQHRMIILRGVENQLSSTIQQLCQSISLDEVQTCIITKTNPLPKAIDGEPYTVTGTLNGEKLNLTFSLPGPGLKDQVTVVLVPGVTWSGGVLDSLQTDPCIEIEKTTNISCITSFDGALYGGTGSNGKLYEWNGESTWVEKAKKLGTETTVNCLAVYDSDGSGPKIYAGMSPNGKLYQWNDVDNWITKAGSFDTQSSINCLAVYNPGTGEGLYAGTSPGGMLLEWDGSSMWIEKAPKLGSETSILSLSVFNNKLYAGTSPNGKLYEWNGVGAWIEKAGTYGSETSINCLVEYGGKLYGGTSPNGMLLEWTSGASSWTQRAPKLAETDILSLAVYDPGDGSGSTIYAGTGQNGKLYRWNGAIWEQKAGTYGSETRVNSLAVFGGKLYGGTGPGGRLYEWDGTAWIQKASIPLIIRFR